MANEPSAVVFNIQRFCLHDGPGLRTTVFLKGCPLRCQWCANPESIAPRPELGYVRGRCDGCGACVPVCREDAIAMAGDRTARIERGRCTACGACVAACRPEAMAVYGKRQPVSEIFEEARRDEIFYGQDGGVTVSGGEPLAQAAAVAALFKLCREVGIGTCIETCGFGTHASLKQVLAWADIVLFDLKHMEPEAHRRLTGRPNARILDNARLAVAGGARVHFRMPLVPGLNDSEENIRATGRFVLELQGEGAAIELMPYHRLGVGKHEALERQYALAHLRAPDPERIEEVQRAIEEMGVRCTVSR